jgi:uncharacterized membrane protein YdjX (TVP38/TMEM64 family)
MTAATITAIGAPRSMTTWIKLGLAAVVIGTLCWGLSSVDYERYLSPTVLIDWLRDAGPLAPLLLIGSMVCAVVIPPIPSVPLDLAAGAVFGPFYGALYAVIGAEIGAIGCFLLARVLGRDALSKLLKVETVFCQRCTDHQLMGLVFFARLLPIFSFDVVSYGAGLTKISLKTFALATLFGMAPPTFAFTYLGSSVISVQWPLILAGMIMVTFFLAAPKILMNYRESRMARLLLGPPPPLSELQPASRSIPSSCAGCENSVPGA